MLHTGRALQYRVTILDYNTRKYTRDNGHGGDPGPIKLLPLHRGSWDLVREATHRVLSRIQQRYVKSCLFMPTKSTDPSSTSRPYGVQVLRDPGTLICRFKSPSASQQLSLQEHLFASAFWLLEYLGPWVTSSDCLNTWARVGYDRN